MNIFSEEKTIFHWCEARYPKGGRYGPRSEPYLSLYQIFEGEMEIIVGSDSRTVQAGEIALICNDREVDYRIGIATYFSWCEIPRPPMPPEIFEKINNVPLVLKGTDRLTQLMDLGLQVNRRGQHGPTEFKNALGRAIFHEYFDQMKLELVENPLPALVKRVKNHIEQHYMEQCDMNTISDYAGVSKRYLFKLFRKHLDTTPVEYLWQLRLNKGVELLYFSGLRVAEIAYQCGFKNPYHFSRYVKQHHGVSPNKLRKTKPYTYGLYQDRDLSGLPTIED